MLSCEAMVWSSGLVVSGGSSGGRVWEAAPGGLFCSTRVSASLSSGSEAESMVSGSDMLEFVAGLEPVEKIDGVTVVAVDTLEIVSALSFLS